MNNHPDVGSPLLNLMPIEVDGFDSLAELALDLRWSWNHAADCLWCELDAELWEQTHNPWIVLQTVSRDRLRQVLALPSFRASVDALVEERRRAMNSEGWFQQACPDSSLNCVAYFCMEYMLSEALPIYSGGLGNVAGDQLKAASDLGLPVVAVGLLYQQGYFHQAIDSDGAQQAFFPYNYPGQLPIMPLRQPNGEWLRLHLDLPGYRIWLRTWQAEVGKVKLYLLDSNDAANYPPYRGIANELYVGSHYHRLLQEMILGIGGWRLLATLGIRPKVCHINEGHAALAVLERARDYMQQTGQTFDEALSTTRAGNLFTTHTAVSAGFDRYSPALVEHCLGGYAQKQLGIPIEEMLALGRLNPGDTGESFNMAYLAIRGSGAVNGVSQLHGEVSRHLFAPLFPRWPVAEIPIGHITNGVHMPSWDSAAADELWTEVVGKERWLGVTERLEEGIRGLPDERLWKFRTETCMALANYARRRLSRELAAAGALNEAVEEARNLLDPNALTIGFARRFAAYKRPNLLLYDQQRLLRLLSDPQRPVQIILAGKAHPQDMEGQQMIRQWTHFIRECGARKHVIFLSDYDMLLTENLVQGVDVWLNTPRRPWEACGTSGMKVLVNGGINFSELDGWWAEAYTPQVGFKLGDGREHDDGPAWDRIEAEELYNTLEQQIIPEFYERDHRGIPVAWVARMRESMATLTPRFSTNRAVREYTEQYYLPMAAAYDKRAANDGALGREIAQWRHEVAQKWHSVRFGVVNVETDGQQTRFEAQVYVDELGIDHVRVELYAEGLEGGAPQRIEMNCTGELIGAAGGYVFGATVAASRASGDYTVRVVPRHPDAAIPLEVDLILWQR